MKNLFQRSVLPPALAVIIALGIILSGCGGSGGGSATDGSTNGSTAGSPPSFRVISNSYGFLSAVSPNGAYVATESEGRHLLRVRTSDGAVDDLGAFSSGGLVPTAISNDGRTIVGSDDRSDGIATKYVPFRWQEGSGFTQIGSFEHSTADAASADLRTIVGAARLDGVWKPFSWRDGTVTMLPVPSGATNGFAKAVAQNGTIYGYVHVDGQDQVVRWVAGSVETIGEPYESLGGRLPVSPSGSHIGVVRGDLATLLTPSGSETVVVAWHPNSLAYQVTEVLPSVIESLPVLRLRKLSCSDRHPQRRSPFAMRQSPLALPHRLAKQNSSELSTCPTTGASLWAPRLMAAQMEHSSFVYHS